MWRGGLVTWQLGDAEAFEEVGVTMDGNERLIPDPVEKPMKFVRYAELPEDDERVQWQEPAMLFIGDDDKTALDLVRTLIGGRWQKESATAESSVIPKSFIAYDGPDQRSTVLCGWKDDSVETGLELTMQVWVQPSEGPKDDLKAPGRIRFQCVTSRGATAIGRIGLINANTISVDLANKIRPAPVVDRRIMISTTERDHLDIRVFEPGPGEDLTFLEQAIFLRKPDTLPEANGRSSSPTD
jgi:hypothetical protein